MTEKKLPKNFILVQVSELFEAKWNYKKTDDTGKIDKLAENMKRNGQVENLLVRKLKNGYEVINGNHRLKALRKNETTHAIVYNFGKINLKQAKRIAVETNETKFVRDDTKFSEILAELSVEFGSDDLVKTMPFSCEEIDDLIKMTFDDEDFEIDNDKEKYTKKVDAPIYKPTGEKPQIQELFDNEKEQKLIEEIEKAKISDEIKEFLKLCARRHIVFDYSKIAEYYCHASKKVQELMENSALIIIDFKKAIEEGYVVLSEEVQQQYLEDYND